MVIQYPDTAVFAYTADPVQDLDGYMTVEASGSLTTSCRCEFNSRGALLGLEDGQMVNYDYTVYQPVHTTDISPGTPVTLTLHNGRTVISTVKRHENNQMNSKSWV